MNHRTGLLAVTVLRVTLLGTALPLAGCLPPVKPGEYQTLSQGFKEITRVPDIDPITRTVTVVPSRRGWWDAGIALQSGDVVRMRPSGTWNTGFPHPWTGPEGLPGWPQYRDAPVGQFASLIGRLGDAYPFALPSNRDLEVTNAGHLQFRMNEQDHLPHNDNQGTMQVEVRIYRPAGIAVDPPPPPPPPPPADAGPIRQKFAIVVGISDYQHRGQWNLTNLRYAARDAEALAKYLKSPAGGRFDHVTVLTDAQATTLNLRRAMKEKLRGVQPDDMVMVFWSGHGSPDPHEMKSLYLITHDTDPKHMASTAYPMAEFQRDLNRLQARNVIVMADTCHSGGIADPTVGLRGPGDNPIVGILRGIGIVPKAETAETQAPAMRLMFTSCEQGEQSRESSELGGGHGVFTYFLLQGLNGKADSPTFGGNSDGQVNLGELIEYTRDQVKRHTNNQQHPDTAGTFNRDLVMGGGG